MTRQETALKVLEALRISGRISRRNDCRARKEQSLASCGRWLYTVGKSNKGGLPRCGKHLSNPNPKAGMSGDGAKRILAYTALTRQRVGVFRFRG